LIPAKSSDLLTPFWLRFLSDFLEPAALPFNGFALVIVTKDDFAGGLEDTVRVCPADDDYFATPLGLGTKRVTSEVD
jgi:hypothetical protein